MTDNINLLPPPQQQVVLMCGVSGSGKTRYARRLEEMGFVRLSPDAILWERFGPELPSLPPQQQRRLFAEAGAEITGRLCRLIETGEKVVVDSTLCHRARRDELRDLCRSKGVEPQLVYMDAPLQLLKKRMAERKGTGPDDQRVADALLETYYSGFERPQADESFITITHCE